MSPPDTHRFVGSGDEAGPVVEGLAVGAFEVGAAFFHFDEDERLPDVVGEGGAAAVFFGFADAELGLAADFEEAFAAEGLEEAVEEDLGLARMALSSSCRRAD